jgi:hypothetical protein
MSSFTEISLSWMFRRRDTPDHVLAAFSSAHAPERSALRGGLEPTALPEPVEEVSTGWDPADGIDPNALDDPYLDQPWRHDWGAALGFGSDVHTVARAGLVWVWDCWTFSCRASWKTDERTAAQALAWIGPYIVAEGHEPTFIGTLQHESSPKPTLLYVTWTGEPIVAWDPSPPHYW